MCCPSWRLLAATWAFLVEGQLVVLVLRTTWPCNSGAGSVALRPWGRVAPLRELGHLRRRLGPCPVPGA